MWLCRLQQIQTRRKFLLTHPVWDVTDCTVRAISKATISTHTSRVGCDRLTDFIYAYQDDFYSHIPCGMWQVGMTYFSVFLEFLLTHPVWDVTAYTQEPPYTARNFYSHIPCGMWQQGNTKNGFKSRFLLTHPVWDVTLIEYVKENLKIKFLLTHPVWDVTCLPQRLILRSQISTHTSRVGCDGISSCFGAKFLHFYSHIPCGMWREHSRGRKRHQRFLLTHPVWDVTNGGTTVSFEIPNFYSHIPCGMWPLWVGWLPTQIGFLLTHPVWDVTLQKHFQFQQYRISTHTSRVGCDQWNLKY